MSQSEDDEVNRREVAYRLFAAEFEDADYSFAESDEERAPNYVVTPTGARVNRMFAVGVLTEVEQVSEDVVRARVVDPTGAFVVYAGQYQPEALAALESADTPSFVAVTGKARTFQPDDADVVYTSIRPEQVSEVDAETRDRWVVATAEQTADRVETMAAAHERVERDDTLEDVLTEAGVQPGLAAGIPLALDHYGTTAAYLEAVRHLALDAARVVAGETNEAGELSVSPSDGGDAALAFAATLDVETKGAGESEAEATATSTADAGATADTETTAEVEATTDAEATGESEPEAGTVDADFGEPDGEEPASSDEEGRADAAEESEPVANDEPSPEAETGSEADSEAGAGADTASEPEPVADEPVDASPATETPEPDEVAAEAAPEGAEEARTDEMYELSEDEREEVKENYDVEFSSGTDIPESEADEEAAGGEAGADKTDTEAEEEDELGDFDPDDGASEESQDDSDTTTGSAEDEADEATSDERTSKEADEAMSDERTSNEADDESTDPDLGLEDYVVNVMDSLDDGDGALREDVVATAADERDADDGEIEDAIQEALMSGRCYESGDDHLKAI